LQKTLDNLLQIANESEIRENARYAKLHLQVWAAEKSTDTSKVQYVQNFTKDLITESFDVLNNI